MNKFVLKNISIEDGGKLVKYDYEVSRGIQKYFRSDSSFYVKYDTDISSTPESILVIPLLANIMPLSWFINFDVFIHSCDKTFLKSLNLLKKQFSIFFPENSISGNINTENSLMNIIKGNSTSLLFSGGLDSYDSLIRNMSKDPYLISVHGADVKIEDSTRWKKFVQFNKEETILNHERLFYVESNLREFYTYRVDLLTTLGWWGGIQHGMALLGILAPLSYKYGITDIRIAASATHEVSYSWGSSPKIDENMKWANTIVTHDGYDQRRTDKIDNVVSFVNQKNQSLKLRVCYADEREGYNCNRCHKCQRTILSLILSNADPAQYGFTVPDDLYEILFGNFNKNVVMTEGIKYQWKCLQDKANEEGQFFVISDIDSEKKSIDKFANLDIDAVVNSNRKKVKRRQRTRLILRERFPIMYKIYQKLKI